MLTDGMHLQTGVGTNNVTKLLPAGPVLTDPHPNNEVPFPDFGRGSSYHTTVGTKYLQRPADQDRATVRQRVVLLVAYTYSRTLSDAGDLLNGGSVERISGSGRAGPWSEVRLGLADFDIRHVFHLSGGYQLPFGKDKASSTTRAGSPTWPFGGWAHQLDRLLQGGQPLTLNCPSGTTSGTNCYDVKVAGQSQKLGLHIDSNGQQNWFGNAKAFQQPCQLGPAGPIADSPAGCIPLTGTHHSRFRSVPLRMGRDSTDSTSRRSRASS